MVMTNRPLPRPFQGPEVSRRTPCLLSTSRGKVMAVLCLIAIYSIVMDSFDLKNTKGVVKLPQGELHFNQGGIEMYYRIVPRSKKTVLLFHGCNHGARDWFQLPQERRIVAAAITAGYSVIAFSSQDRTGRRCWDTRWPISSNVDFRYVSKGLRMLHDRGHHWYDGEPGDGLFAIGASSGGEFASMLMHKIALSGVSIIISPGSVIALQTIQHPPPVSFVYMPADTFYASTEQVEQSAALLRSKGGKVRIHKCHPRPWSSESLSQDIPEVPVTVARDLYYSAWLLGWLDDRGLFKIDPRGQPAMFQQLLERLKGQKYTQAWDTVQAHGPKIQEMLYVYAGTHELTAEHIDKVIAEFDAVSEPDGASG